MSYKESVFVFTWFDGKQETLIANFDDCENSNNLKEYFKTCVQNYKLLKITKKNKIINETYPNFICGGNSISCPTHKELLFFLV